MVADRITTEIWKTRSSKGDALQIPRDSASRFRGYALDAKGLELWLPQVIFRRGNRAGFDRSLRLLTGHAWKMNDPAAAIAILELVMRFERVRFEIASDADGKLRTLRARKFGV